MVLSDAVCNCLAHCPPGRSSAAVPPRSQRPVPVFVCPDLPVCDGCTLSPAPGPLFPFPISSKPLPPSITLSPLRLRLKRWDACPAASPASGVGGGLCSLSTTSWLLAVGEPPWAACQRLPALPVSPAACSLLLPAARGGGQQPASRILRKPGWAAHTSWGDGSEQHFSKARTRAWLWLPATQNADHTVLLYVPETVRPAEVTALG